MKKLIAMMLMLTMVFFIACDKDEDNNEMSPADAKVALEELNTDMSGYFDEMLNAEGVKAMEALMELPLDPFSGKKSNEPSAVLLNMQKLILPSNYERTKIALETGLFDFDSNVGTYTWNATYEKWDVAHGVPSYKIIINFPTENSTTNDATITISSYDETNIGEDYYPTELAADLTIDNIEYVNIDFSASWKTGGEPEILSVEIYLNPFTFGGSFSNIGTTASVNFDIDYEEILIFAAGVGATFETTNWDNPPLNINGYIQLLNVKVEVDVNFENIAQIIQDVENGTSTATDLDELAEAINAEIDAYVSVDGVKAVDIEFEFDRIFSDYSIPIDEEIGLYININFVFSDGSIAPAYPYFEDFATDIEEFFSFLEEIFSGDSM
ncbi:MAG: hypothetical protein KAR57_02505 [Bacteroidales bacterium]|nr:hypothetical protein [Bacteroidales bacterium]